MAGAIKSFVYPKKHKRVVVEDQYDNYPDGKKIMIQFKGKFDD